MNTQKIILSAVALCVATYACISLINSNTSKEALPLVAIANYGPHSSLEATITGIKEGLTARGFIEGKTVRYVVSDVSFDTSLIPQMITQLAARKPRVLVTLATPVAQCAKGMVKDIPLVFAAITDPVSAELIKSEKASDQNMTGSSERQDLNALLAFARTLLPTARRIGLLYGTGENNDHALLGLIKAAAKRADMQLVALPVNAARDIPIVMQQFKGKIDFLYVGSSGTIQPALPTIAKIADDMAIPVLNVDQGAVEEGMVLGSFGVDFKRVGLHAGHLAASLIEGTPMKDLPPHYPTLEDHVAYLSRTRAEKLGIAISTLNATILG